MAEPSYKFLRDRLGRTELIFAPEGPYRIERDDIGRLTGVVYEGPGEDSNRQVGIAASMFDVELRSAIKGNTIEGYASVFHQVTDLRTYYERIAPTAFDAALGKGADVRALFNHDPAQLLGRQSAGTLRLWTDSRGLGFEVDLPNTTVGRDVRELAERGDLNGASFGFVPGQDTWELAKDGKQIRTHVSVKELREVSVVSFPAYQGAQVHLRADDLVQTSDEIDFVRRNKSRLIKARHQNRSV